MIRSRLIDVCKHSCCGSQQLDLYRRPDTKYLVDPYWSITRQVKRHCASAPHGSEEHHDLIRRNFQAPNATFSLRRHTA